MRFWSTLVPKINAITSKTQWVNGQVVTRLKIEVRGSFPEEKESDWCLMIKTVSVAIIICRDTFFYNCVNFYCSNDYQKQVKYWFALRPKYMTQKYASIGLFAVDCFIYCFAEDNNSSNDNSNSSSNNSVTNVKNVKLRILASTMILPMRTNRFLHISWFCSTWSNKNDNDNNNNNKNSNNNNNSNLIISHYRVFITRFQEF